MPTNSSGIQCYSLITVLCRLERTIWQTFDSIIKTFVANNIIFCHKLTSVQIPGMLSIVLVHELCVPEMTKRTSFKLEHRYNIIIQLIKSSLL